MKPAFTMATYAIGIISSKLVALALQPFVTQWLGPEQFGRLDVLITLGSFLSLLLALGLTDAIYRFAHDKDENHQQEIFSGALWLILLCGGGITLLAQIASPAIQGFLPGNPPVFALRCLFFTLFINTLCTVPFAILRIRNQAGLFVGAQIVFAFIQGGGILLLTSDYGIDGIMAAGLMAQLTQLIVLSKTFPVPKASHQKLLLRYGAAITFSALLGFISLGAERWAIAHFLSLEQLAPYAIAMQWTLAASLLLEPFSLWWFPKRFSLTGSANGQQQAANISITGCQLGTLITAGTITIGSKFLIFWLPPGFHASAEIIPLLGVMLMIKHAATLLNMGCYQQEKAHSVMVIGLISCALSLTILFFILPNFGLYALLVSNIILQLLRLLLFYGWSQHCLPLPYPLPRLLLSYGLIALLLFVHYQELHIYEGLILLLLVVQVCWPWLRKMPIRYTLGA